MFTWEIYSTAVSVTATYTNFLKPIYFQSSYFHFGLSIVGAQN